MILRLILQWLLIGLVLRVVWGLVKAVSGSRPAGDRTPPGKPEETGRRMKDPAWKSEDVLDVRYEDVPEERKTL